MSIGVNQTNNFSMQDKIENDKLRSLDYLHAFCGFKVLDMISNDDVFSLEYGKVEMFELPRTKDSQNKNLVHKSRLLHAQTRKLEDEKKGQPLLEPIYDILTVLDTALWSVGQILYDFTFKVYKSDDIENMTTEERRELGILMYFMFRTEALAIIGKGEDLTKQSTSVGGIKELLDYGWDMLAGGTRMPKSVIKGQEAGTIAGAQYDVMNYYGRIAAQQESDMKPDLDEDDLQLLQEELVLAAQRKCQVKMKSWKDKKFHYHIVIIQELNTHSRSIVYEDPSGTYQLTTQDLVGIWMID